MAFTLNDLRIIMRDCMGEEEEGALDGDIAHVPFNELGYDSISIIELANELSDRLKIEFTADPVEELKTPQNAIEYVNQRRDLMYEEEEIHGWTNR